MNNQDLIKKLKSMKKLEAAGSPQEGWILSNRKILMSQISPYQSEKAWSRQISANYIFQYIGECFKVKLLRPAVATFVIVILMLGYTATSNVADASLPGDMLYPVKTATEQVQLAFTFNAEKKVQLQMDFVGRRVDELEQIVRQDDNHQSKAKNISNAVRKISKNVKSVNDGLGRIKAASADFNVLAVAKEIDTKTLQVSQSLSESNEQLPIEVQKEVSVAIYEAIYETEETGANALGVIVEKYEIGEGEVTSEEVATRVAKRIKKAEKTIQDTATDQGLASDKILDVDNVNYDSNEIVIVDENFQIISDKSQEAQAVIEEAKDLLDSKDFSSALLKIQESKKIVVGAVGVVKNMFEEEAVNAENTLPQESSSTNQVIKEDNSSVNIKVGEINNIELGD